MWALFPVILVDLSLYSRELIARRPSIHALGGGFALAALFLLVMIFAQVFTTVYDYIPDVGPLFRDRFWLVFFVLGLAMMLPLLLIRRAAPATERVSSKTAGGLAAFIAVAALAGALWRSSAPSTVLPTSSTLRVLTYNIQQGYSAAGQLNYVGQLTLIQQAKPDVIGLEESDTNRISGGNSDLVRYFADNLGFYSYYGPKTVAGTFGIALLSRYPIENPHVVYLYSSGEQTAAIIVQIAVGGKRFNVFVTHLGNDGPIVQQQNLLQAIDGSASVIAMGDFNFQPNGEQYRLTRTVLDDAWLLRWPQGVDDQGYDPHDRIDHIFVSSGTIIQEAHFLTAPESDHPALLVQIGW
jgi:endonuclease/exonuclease/phosphatase family metal-dependent hydrolase